MYKLSQSFNCLVQSGGKVHISKELIANVNLSCNVCRDLVPRLSDWLIDEGLS